MARGSRNLKVKNAFYQHIFLDVLTHLYIFRNSHDVSRHCPQHQPYQPPTPAGHSAVKYTLLAREYGNGKVDIIFNIMFLYYIHPHLHLHCHNATINSPNNTTPRDNHPFGLKTKGSANKKGEK
jgi:hypothetical protein